MRKSSKVISTILLAAIIFISSNISVSANPRPIVTTSFIPVAEVNVTLSK